MGLVSGRSKSPQITFTRPANTTSYSIGDVIGSADSANLLLDNVGDPGSLVQVVFASLLINSATLPTGMTGLRVHLWDQARGAIADNAAFSTIAADRAKYRGDIALPTPSVIGNGFLFSFAGYVGRPIRLVSSQLWANLVTDTAITTPASALEFELHLDLVEVGA